MGGGQDSWVPGMQLIYKFIDDQLKKNKKKTHNWLNKSNKVIGV